MNYFVWYCDGYFEDGCVGLQEFSNEGLALQYIEERLRDPRNKSPDKNDYILIKGERLELEVMQVISKLGIKKK